jgi:tight adherence protein C
VQLGRSRNEAMRNLAARCDVPELSAFVLAMVQADVFGVSVANVLRIQAAPARRGSGDEGPQQGPVACTRLYLPRPCSW